MAQQSRVGELLAGKYRLDALLGSGGVGEVYRAQNTLIGRTVAIKLLKPEHVTDEDVIVRFLREARAATLARHPNVVDVLDVGKDEAGIPFIVQEFLEGMDLGQRLKAQARAMSTRETLELMIPVVQAVAMAHSRGVVHRDLKPENVFLARVGGTTVPKLLDFGISYVKPKPGDIRMTKTGMTVGTPAYMSPEQLEGTEGVDARTDVWALGVILYEALAGRLPFEGESHALLFAQIAWVDPVPLREVAPHVPTDLAEVVGRCLRRTVADRYPSASELARDLTHVRGGRPIEPTQKRSLPPKMPAGGAQIDVRIPPSGRRLDLAMATSDGGRPDFLPVAASIESNDVVAKSGIDLATIRPPPGHDADGATREQPEGWTTAGVKAAASLGGMGLLGVATWMMVFHQSGGWAAHEWLAPVLDPSMPLQAGVLSVACAGAGLSMVVRVVRNKPRLWGLLATALGLAIVAVPSVMTLLAAAEGPLGEAAPSSSLGWGLSLAALGLAAAAAQLAGTTWAEGTKAARVVSVISAFAAATCLSAAVDIARALLAVP